MILKKQLVFTAATIVTPLAILWSVRTYGFRSPLSALVLNWFTVCWIASASLVVRLMLPLGYYKIRAFERTGRIYERMGIRVAKRLLRRGPLSIFSRHIRAPKNKTIPALKHLEDQMRGAETIHVLVWLVMLSAAAYAAMREWLDAAVWILLFNVLINGYPIMLQRYNRAKLEEWIEAQTVRGPTTQGYVPPV